MKSGEETSVVDETTRASLGRNSDGGGDGGVENSGGFNKGKEEEGNVQKDFNGERVFLPRGTSASRALLPRPEQPSTDPLEELFLAATSTPSVAAEEPTATPAAPAAQDIKPASLVAGGVRRGRVSRDENGANRSPPSAPSSSTPPGSGRRRRANVVLSDMAPSFSGDRDTDQARVAALVLDALAACLGDEATRLREQPQRCGAGAGGSDPQDREARGRSTGAAAYPCRADGDEAMSSTRSSGRILPGKGGQGSVTDVPGISSPGPGEMNSSSSSRRSDVRGRLTVPCSENERNVGGGGDEIEEEESDGTGLLARGGTFLGKFFAGRDEREVKEEAERLFERVKVVKPPASRSGSGEKYLLATGFLLGGRKKR